MKALVMTLKWLQSLPMPRKSVQKSLWHKLGFCPNWQNSTTQNWASQKKQKKILLCLHFNLYFKIPSLVPDLDGSPSLGLNVLLCLWRPPARGPASWVCGVPLTHPPPPTTTEAEKWATLGCLLIHLLDLQRQRHRCTTLTSPTHCYDYFFQTLIIHCLFLVPTLKKILFL